VNAAVVAEMFENWSVGLMRMLATMTVRSYSAERQMPSTMQHEADAACIPTHGSSALEGLSSLRFSWRVLRRSSLAAKRSARLFVCGLLAWARREMVSRRVFLAFSATAARCSGVMSR